MAQYRTHNVAPMRPSSGGRLSSLPDHHRRSQLPAGAEHGSPSLRTTQMLPYAQGVHIQDSSLTVVGGDVVHDHSRHYHYERPRDVWMILQSIPNFRNIYHGMLSKATLGTGMWLVKGDKFRVWLEPNGDIKIFWGSGIPGAGKTILASIVIQCLEALRKETEGKICVCYVYFRYSDRSKMTVRNVLEVLAMQTLERHPDCLALIEETYAQHLHERTEPTEAQLLTLLGQLTKSMTATFYILDALDEAHTKTQLAVVRALASLNVKLFITSRPLKTVEASFPAAHTFPIIAQDTDIDLHIAKAINENAELQRLLQDDPELRDKIISTIKGNCGGMFLHASLQIDALGECLSAQDVTDTLKAFPSSIEDVYRQTWDRISNESHKHASLAKAVLVWVLNASRSMTIDELERAVATSPDTHKFEPRRLVPETTLVSLCGGLITVEEESRVVRLVHYTAKDTLEDLLRNAFPHPHSLLATVCMTHLSKCGLQNTTINSEDEFKSVLEKDPLLAYASEAWAFHAREELGSEDIRRRTAQFIMEVTAFPAFTSADRSWYFDILSPIHIPGLHDLPFTLIDDPAASNPNLTTKFHQQSALIIVSRFGHERPVASLLAMSEIQVNLIEDDGWSALMEASRHGYTDIVALLLAHPGVLVNLWDNEGWSALMLAVRHGHDGTVKLLVAHPDIQVNLVKTDGWSALMLAARYGHKGIVKLLLAHPDIQVNPVHSDQWSAFMMAASEGYQGIVKLLLAHPDIQVNLVNNEGWSAVMMAARHGHEGTVKLLLAHPDIQVNLVSNEGWSAPMMAARDGYEGTTRPLLAHPDIQVNLVDKKGWSALMKAANEGHEGTIRLLLAHPDTQVNLVNDEGWSALMMAAGYGHEGTIRLLLAHPDIQVNLVDNKEWSALILAAGYGHEGTVKLLLAHPDIRVNLVDNTGWSALMKAAGCGYEGTVELLLAHPNIQVNMVDNEKWSALMKAAWYSYEGTVKLLLAHPDIQVSLVDNKRWSALMKAARQGHEGTVKLLLAHPDIQVNLLSNEGCSALMMAVCGGYQGTVKLLLAHPEVQVNLADNYSSTALLLAAERGHEAAVELILATSNVNLNAFDKDRDTAIKMAAQHGYEAVVCLLLDVLNVDTTIRSSRDGHTAMSVAQANGHSGIVQRLQDFELRQAAVASPLGTHPLSAKDNHIEDASDSDSDSSEGYFDAKELFEDADQGEAIV
ncbi:ankyrin repeat-containing domain protein [Coprinopsis sp. MPI-PUGE-AT-0042]|nr:ankyrin repeat-containing domain protein [Coprinopsis sp. MPI-PUGE-AT-0042]